MSINVSEHNHLSQSLCDVSVEHADTSHFCIPHDTSRHSQNSIIAQCSSSGEVDKCAGKFDCNICTHVCRDPVVTMCGHLFCWPCLFACLSLNSASKECPVCKADVQDKIVPLYGCGKVGYSTDSLAEKLCGIHIPCRPSATRWIAPITYANASRRRSELHTHPSAHSGFCAWLGTLLYLLKMVAFFVGILAALFRSEMHTRRSAHSGFSGWVGTLLYFLKMVAIFVAELFGYWCSERGSTMRRSLYSFGCSFMWPWLKLLVERRT